MTSVDKKFGLVKFQLSEKVNKNIPIGIILNVTNFTPLNFLLIFMFHNCVLNLKLVKLDYCPLHKINKYVFNIILSPIITNEIAIVFLFHAEVGNLIKLKCFISFHS